ncbi:MAG: DUF1854 domain-containing protein [Polynucleobacter victoriensis]
MANTFTLSRNSFGSLCLQDQAGVTHEQVVPVRAFPISHPNESIAIVDRDGHELVWLDSLGQATEPNQQLINEELASREFMPVLTGIEDVSTFATPSTWTVKTNRGHTQFILRGEEDIRRVNKTMYLVSDTHGVQYLIQDIQALDKHSRRLLDRFL